MSVSIEDSNKFEDDLYDYVKKELEPMSSNDRIGHVMMNIGPYIEALMAYENPSQVALLVAELLRVSLYAKKTGELPGKLKGHEKDIIRPQ